MPKTTTWRDTGFGGTNGRRSWQRLIGEIEATRNGSFVQFDIRFPGERESRSFRLLASDLEIVATSPHRSGLKMRIETDTEIETATREVLG